MVREYRAVADAIIEGDEDQAERLMRRHIQATAQRTIPRLADDARAAGGAR
jgi:DNA-binding FadR family transcriptional regulator